jgi:hypothetical protein
MSVTDRISSLTPEQRALFEALRKKKAAPKVDLRPPAIPRLERYPGKPWPLSLDQERLWFLYKMAPERTQYNIDTTTRLEGPLDVGRLRRAFRDVARRHEAWRTRFVELDGRPVQVVSEPGDDMEIPVPLVDLRALPRERRQEEAYRGNARLLRHPFVLEEGPLVRTALFRIEDELYDCPLVIHHIVTDWVTFQECWREVSALYQSYETGEAPELPELPVHYVDYAVWQREWMQGEVLEAFGRYWQEKLAGASLASALPTDRPRPALQPIEAERVRVEYTPEKTAAIKAAARREGVTIFMTLLGLYEAVLFRYSGQEKVLVATSNAGRNRPEIHDVLGFFLAPLVFCIDFSGDPTLREVLQRARETALGAYAHQDIPFAKLIEALEAPRDPSRTPVVQEVLLVLDGSFVDYRLPEVKISAGESPYDRAARFDQMVGLWDAPTRIFGNWEYASALWDRASVERMVDALYAVTEALLNEPDLRLSQVSLLPLSARHQVQAAALPMSTASAAGGGSPGTPLEKTLVAVCAEVLERPVGIHDNFFAAGGDSLLALRLKALLLDRFGVELPVLWLFETVDLAELAGRLSGSGADR